MRSIRRTLKSVEMWTRQRLPQPARQFFRALQTLKGVKLSEEIVPQELLDECQVIASRADILTRMPKQAIVAEVGTLKGQFARKIERITKPRELHLIDINYARFQIEGLTKDSVIRHKGLSHEVLEGFEENYFDWIYIDADHSYNSVLRDANVASGKLKPGGFLIFNDFGHMSPMGGHFGVHRAAVEFSVSHKWKWRYLSYHKSALYDLAIQKPGDGFSDRLISPD